MTAGNDPSAPGAFTPQADQPGPVDMGQLQPPEDLFHPRINIFGQMVLNHKQEEMVAGQRFEDYRKDPPLSRIKGVPNPDIEKQLVSSREDLETFFRRRGLDCLKRLLIHIR